MGIEPVNSTVASVCDCAGWIKQNESIDRVLGVGIKELKYMHIEFYI